MSNKKTLAKKIQKATDKLLADGSLWGFDFDDIIIKGRKLMATGEADFGGVEAEIDMIVRFNKRARPKVITVSADYDGLDTTMVQGYEFSNFKKYEKAIKKDSHAEKQDAALEYFDQGTESALQKGIDMFEEIPGVGDLWMSIVSTDIPSFYIT